MLFLYQAGHPEKEILLRFQLLFGSGMQLKNILIYLHQIQPRNHHPAHCPSGCVCGFIPCITIFILTMRRAPKFCPAKGYNGCLQENSGLHLVSTKWSRLHPAFALTWRCGPTESTAAACDAPVQTRRPSIVIKVEFCIKN